MSNCRDIGSDPISAQNNQKPWSVPYLLFPLLHGLIANLFSLRPIFDPNNKLQGGVILKKILFFILILCAAPVSATEMFVPTDKQKQELMEIMKHLKLVPDVGKNNPLCISFLDEFKKQIHVEYIKPIIQTDNYDDPMLKGYRDKCPKLVLNKHVGFARVGPYEVEKSLREQGVPEDKLDEELDKYASSITYGTRNFKLFKIELDNNPNNGEEYVFYDQDERTVIPERYAGEISYPGAGVYNLVDFRNCNFRGGVAVGSYFLIASSMKDKPKVSSYHGLITYKQNNYIFNFESIKATNGGLDLHTYNQRQGRLRPLCSYRTY